MILLYFNKTKIQPGGGMTGVLRETVEVCKANGNAVIPGSCPNQLLKPDFGHAMMRGLWRMVGIMPA